MDLEKERKISNEILMYLSEKMVELIEDSEDFEIATVVMLRVLIKHIGIILSVVALSNKNDVDEMCERLKGLIKEEILNK